MMTEALSNAVIEQTRTRLLEAARVVFSQHGFQGATVREICRRAKANVAAVNYHFGSKNGLLAEALNFTSLKAMQNANVTASDCPKHRLSLFIHDFMLMLLDENNPSSQCQMMARELADPTPALDKIVREAIEPMHEFLSKIVREIIGKKTSEGNLRLCVHSILGQCLFYRQSQLVLKHLHPEMHFDKKEIKSIAEHIAVFSMAGIKHFDTSPS